MSQLWKELREVCSGRWNNMCKGPEAGRDEVGMGLICLMGSLGFISGVRSPWRVFSMGVAWSN